MVDSWIDVRDNLPNDARQVYVLLKRGFIGVGRLWKEKPLLWKDNGRSPLYDVTHWADSLSGYQCASRTFIGLDDLPSLLGQDYEQLPQSYSRKPGMRTIQFHPQIYSAPVLAKAA